MKQAPTLIIDAPHLCYMSMSYYPYLLKENETPINVIMAVLQWMIIFQTRLKTNRIIWCWDSRISFRKRQFAYYKSRKKSPDMLETYKQVYTQMDLLRTDILPGMGFENNFRQRGLEADDLIAQACKQVVGPKIILSSDHDMYQLLSNMTYVYDLRKSNVVTEKSFSEEYGISPKKWAIMKAIAGCTSDTVPGIVGVGEKSVLKYLRGEHLPARKLNLIKLNKVKALKEFLPIVKLPHRKTVPLKLQNDSFSWKKFKLVFIKYKFNNLIKEKAEWLDFIANTTGDKKQKRGLSDER